MSLPEATGSPLAKRCPPPSRKHSTTGRRQSPERTGQPTRVSRPGQVPNDTICPKQDLVGIITQQLICQHRRYICIYIYTQGMVHERCHPSSPQGRWACRLCPESRSRCFLRQHERTVPMFPESSTKLGLMPILETAAQGMMGGWGAKMPEPLAD